MAAIVSLTPNGHASLAVRDRESAALVIASRYDIFSAGVEALLQSAGHRVVARCSREDELQCSVEAHRPDIVMLADNVMGQSAAITVSRLRMHSRSMPIIFLLERQSPTKIADLMELDVEGIVSSSAPAGSFADCVRSVSRGGKWVDPDLVRELVLVERSPLIAPSLTSREGDIACLVSRGLRNKEIARGLNLSEGTVKMHLHHIYEKLHLSGRTQLALSLAGGQAQAGDEDPHTVWDGLNFPAAAKPVNGRG